jgi:hypothetical protein
LEIYLDRKENNIFSFELNLFQEHEAADLSTFAYFLKQNKIDTVSILIPDDIVHTKSFIYDTQIQQIDKKEVIGLAESFVNFKMDPEALDYILIQQDSKTLIRAQIYEPKKILNLKNNIGKLGLNVTSIKPVSASLVTPISEVNAQDFFIIYPLNDYEVTLILAKNNTVYLTTNLKGQSLDIQKIVNYSKLYFGNLTKKIYLPDNRQLEINSTTKLDQSLYSEAQIAQSHGKSTNMPLPMISELSISKADNTAIIKQSPQVNDVNPIKPMENKKNLLPIIAVFVFTAALASVIIWFVLNRNGSQEKIENPISENSQQETAPTSTPTLIPTPTVPAVVAELKKSIKIQVLNATDINGQAATLKNKLTKLGFTSVAVGNSKETATENQVQLKASLTGGQAYFESKMSDFMATFTSDLKETGTYDAVFIIGTDLSTGAAAPSTTTVTPTKTASPTAKPTLSQ